jgi:putative ABC transport system substrate-binding protein
LNIDLRNGPDQLAAAATELAQLPVDVIVTFGAEATQAAKQATTTIPIVMAGVGDPITAGFVASLARPGGNITGNSILSREVAASSRHSRKPMNTSENESKN